MSVLVVRIQPPDLESCSDWLFQLGATAIEERLDDADPTLIVGFRSDEAALAARSLLQERWACRLEDTGDETAWRDRWLRYLEPIEASGLLFHAPWHDVADTPPERRVSVDPGRAFGSGHHPTTRLAIEALRVHVDPDDLVLDVGCGTGILAIVAARFGAAEVTAVDVDHDVLAIAEGNIDANNLGHRVTTSNESILDLGRQFDIVVANIVIGELAPLVPRLVGCSERLTIVSGFLDYQLESLLDDVQVTLVERASLDGWACAALAPNV